MERTYTVRENWLTRSPHPRAFFWAFLISLAVALIGLLSFDESGAVYATLRATPSAVFSRGEYWRALTTLFVHADLGHLLSNLFLFIPLTYLTLAYFGPGLLVLGFAGGAMVNVAVLSTMPVGSSLVGISGLVYWLGAAWLTLFLLLDRRERLKRRFGSALFLFLLLFVPETLRPEVSHLSHFLGFVSGMVMAGAYYAWQRGKLEAAEIREEIVAGPDFFDWVEEERSPEPECATCSG